MDIISKQIRSLLIVTLMILVLSGCTSMSNNLPEHSQAPGSIDNLNPDYGYAQATMDYGQRQLLDLSRRSTEVSQEMVRAADSAAQTTLEYNQRRQLDLDFQATYISLNITQAAATQEFLAQETRLAVQATAVAESDAATATQAAYVVLVTQTAQAQAIIDAQAQQTAQVVAAMTAYPMTATPFAMTQAALLMQQYGREQQAFENQIITPLMPFIVFFLVLMVILVIILAYRRFMLGSWSRLMRIGSGSLNPRPRVMIDGVILDVDPNTSRTIPSTLGPVSVASLPGKNVIQVEIIDPTDPSVAHWIAEVEQQLDNEGGVSS
jgi:hypothetical protein